MDVLVTGASGFFGSALLPLLGAHRVTALAREPLGGVETIAVDLRDRDATRRALEPWRWDAVVHLAGPAPKVEQEWSAAAETIRAHVQMLVHVIAAIPAEWPGRFVQASGAIVYGTPEAELVTESHSRRPLHPYALAKCLTEDIVLGSALGDRWVLRTGGLFSVRRRSGAVHAFARAAKHGDVLRVTSSTPPVPWELLDVDDAAEAVVRVLASRARDPGPLNVGYGERVHIVEIAERFARRTGARVALEGPSPPAFHADTSRARALIGGPTRTLDERLDEVWRSIDGGTT